MRLPRFATPLLALLLLAATGASAQVEVGVKLTDSGTTKWKTTHNGKKAEYLVGPYTAELTLDGEKVGGVEVFCVDFLHQVTRGQQWKAYASLLNGSLTSTLYGPAARTQYRQAAWLTTQYATAPTTEWGNIQGTIWNLFTGSAPDPANSFWLDLATKNYKSIRTDRVAILTDKKGMSGKGQEFVLTMPGSTVTPEPGTLLLMASGLLGVVGFGLRRLG